MEGIEYMFTAKPYQHSVVEGTFVSLPKHISLEIRNNFKRMEEGWGRLRVIAKTGESEWQTAIWFDTKQETYLLPLKASIRKKENIILNKEIVISVLI